MDWFMSEECKKCYSRNTIVSEGEHGKIITCNQDGCNNVSDL